jgi:hypothetical protein
MTPAERAKHLYDTITDFGWEVRWPHAKPVPDDAWPKDLIQKELEKAFADGRASTRFNPVSQF